MGAGKARWVNECGDGTGSGCRESDAGATMPEHARLRSNAVGSKSARSGAGDEASTQLRPNTDVSKSALKRFRDESGRSICPRSKTSGATPSLAQLCTSEGRPRIAKSGKGIGEPVRTKP